MDYILFDKIMKAPNDYKNDIIRLTQFLDLKCHDGMALVGALGIDLFENKFMYDEDDEDTLLYIVWANNEKTNFKVERRSINDIWDEIGHKLALTPYNLDVLLQHIRFYDDYDAYNKLSDFWDVMNTRQRGKYVTSSFELFGAPDFLLYIPDVVDSFDFRTLLAYMETWSGGGSIRVLEMLRTHWEEMDDKQKLRWCDCVNDWDIDGEEFMGALLEELKHIADSGRV